MKPIDTIMSTLGVRQKTIHDQPPELKKKTHKWSLKKVFRKDSEDGRVGAISPSFQNLDPAREMELQAASPHNQMYSVFPESQPSDSLPRTTTVQQITPGPLPATSTVSRPRTAGPPSVQLMQFPLPPSNTDIQSDSHLLAHTNAVGQSGSWPPTQGNPNPQLIARKQTAQGSRQNTQDTSKSSPSPTNTEATRPAARDGSTDYAPAPLNILLRNGTSQRTGSAFGRNSSDLAESDPDGTGLSNLLPERSRGEGNRYDRALNTAVLRDAAEPSDDGLAHVAKLAEQSELSQQSEAVMQPAKLAEQFELSLQSEAVIQPATLEDGNLHLIKQNDDIVRMKSYYNLRLGLLKSQVDQAEAAKRAAQFEKQDAEWQHQQIIDNQNSQLEMLRKDGQRLREEGRRSAEKDAESNLKAAENRVRCAEREVNRLKQEVSEAGKELESIMQAQKEEMESKTQELRQMESDFIANEQLLKKAQDELARVNRQLAAVNADCDEMRQDHEAQNATILKLLGESGLQRDNAVFIESYTALRNKIQSWSNDYFRGPLAYRASASPNLRDITLECNEYIDSPTMRPKLVQACVWTILSKRIFACHKKNSAALWWAHPQQWELSGLLSYLEPSGKSSRSDLLF
jgi:hypothetical protein